MRLILWAHYLFMGVTMSDKTEKLREIMRKHKLSNKTVAEMIGRSEQTVRIWSCANGGREIPTTVLELLEFKVK